MHPDDTTPLDAAQLAAHIAHSPRAVARAATEIAYAAGASGNVGPWQVLRSAWCELFQVSPADAPDAIQTFIWTHED